MKNCRLKHMAWKVCEYVEGVGEYLYVSSLMHPYIKKKQMTAVTRQLTL